MFWLYDYKSVISHIISIIRRMEQINRLKVVLAEKQKTGKWLAESLEKNGATVDGVQMSLTHLWKHWLQ